MSVEQESMPKHPSDSVFIRKPKTVKPSKGSVPVKSSKGDSENGDVRDEKDGAGFVGKKRKGYCPESDSGETQSIEKDSKCEEMEEEEIKEMDFCGMLNRVLPDSIRALGWCEVTPDFSSRFSCAYRKYRYFFVRRDLDIDAMKAGAALLVGDHDFRNICKIDIAKVTNFKREVYSANIMLFQENIEHPELSVYMLEIRGIAFLWHMVRCIMALLFMIGEGEENPDAVTALLDIENMPAKPHYKMAPELPLVLHECGFDNMKINLQPPVLWTLTGHYEQLWEKHTIAAARAKNALESLKSWEVRTSDVDVFVSYLTGKKKAISDRKSGWKGDKSSAAVDKIQKNKTLLLTSGDLGCDSIRDPLDRTADVTSRSVESTNAMYAEVEMTGGGGGFETGTCNSSDPTLVVWSQVLGLLYSRHGLSPIDPLLPHVPLIQVLHCKISI
jgi:tRNA pseudouridine(38-40) synthase